MKNECKVPIHVLESKKLYSRLYKKYKNKSLKTGNRKKRKHYKKMASKYFHLQLNTNTKYYKAVKSYQGWVGSNSFKYYKWQTNKPGKYKYFVYAVDQAGNSQSNVANNIIIIR